MLELSSASLLLASGRRTQGRSCRYLSTFNLKLSARRFDWKPLKFIGKLCLIIDDRCLILHIIWLKVTIVSY